MVRWFLHLALLGAAAAALAAEPATAPGAWWNAAWTHRKRVRVRLAAEEPIGINYRPPKTTGDDLLAAEARIGCEVPLKAGAQREIRVVDSGGNLLPCAVAEADARGLVAVTFPTPRTISGQLAGPIQDSTKAVALGVGRDKAVTVGLRFSVLAGADSVATLEVVAVEAKTSTARVVEKSVPMIAQGTPIRSQVLTEADYYIYYGNPAAAEPAPVWSPTTAPVAQYTWRLTTGDAPSTSPDFTLDRLRRNMRANPQYVGTRTSTLITYGQSSLAADSELWSVTAYEAMVKCDYSAVYRFSLDTGGPSFLFIDGRPAAQRVGIFMQTGQFEQRGKLRLDKGYHHLVLFAGENAQRFKTRLGWQAPDATVFSETPAAFFVTRIQAEPVGLEVRGQAGQAFFTYSLAPRSLVAAKGARYQFVQFQNLTPLAAEHEGKDVTWLWEFGDGASARETAPGHFYALPGGGAAPFPVTLHAYLAAREVGAYARTIYCDPRPSERLNLALDIVSFSNIVYDDERTNIAVRLRNAGYSPVVLRAVGRLESREARQIILNQSVLINAQDESFCILPIDMKQLKDKRGAIDLEVSLGPQRVLGAAMRIIPAADLGRPGRVSVGRGRILLEPAGPYTGVACTAEFPANHYEVTLQAQRLSGQGLCGLTLPVGTHHCTLQPRDWDAAFEPNRWYTLRVQVTDAKVEAWVDDRQVVDMKAADCVAACPTLFDPLKPFGIHVSRDAEVALRKIGVRPLAPQTTDAKPEQVAWQNLFDGKSLGGWRTAAETELGVLHHGLGTLLDEEGRRVMISAEIEDPDRHLEWVFPRYIRETYIDKRRRVFLFGDQMDNLVAPDKSFTDYVGILDQRLKKAGRPFQFVPRTTGLLPTLADIVLFAQTLRGLKPLPDIILLSPGLPDVVQAVGERDFARSLDVMIDCVRAMPKPIRVIIVSPPPSPRNVLVSRLYTQAAHRVAKDHHVLFLDLDELLTKGQDDWTQACYAIPDAEGMLYENPNESAHRRMADAIEKLLD